LIFITVQYLHLASPIEEEETFFPRPWWEGLGEGGELILIFIPDHTKWSRRFSASNDPEQDDHDGDHQKNVNETAHGGRSD